MRNSLQYFAYGSNLHPVRLRQRIGGSRCAGVALLRNALIHFNKIGIDGSGKCSIELTHSPGDTVVGAIYDVTEHQKQLLDDWESNECGYRAINIRVEANETSADAFTYAASHDDVDDSMLPFDWYKELVVLGAMHHDFPPRYIEQLAAQDSLADSDVQRAACYASLIARMRKLTRR